MDTRMIVGFALVAVGVIDAIVGLLVVVPRSPEGTRPVLKAALLGASALLILLGGAILGGVLSP